MEPDGQRWNAPPTPTNLPPEVTGSLASWVDGSHGEFWFQLKTVAMGSDGQD